MSTSQSGLVRLLSSPWTRRGVLALGAGAGVTALKAEDQAQRNRQLANEHLIQRLPEIRTALAAAKPGYAFLSGNSHAEIVGNVLAHQLPVVNGGIGGTSARGYAAQINEMPFSTRSAVAVLFVGTNDILRKAAPLSQDTIAGFKAAVTHIVGYLRLNADGVLVAAVPPLGPEAVTTRDPMAVAVYTAILRDLCANQGCRFFDPFTALRDGEPGMTTQAAHPDGVHLRDYDAVASELAKLLREMGGLAQQ